MHGNSTSVDVPLYSERFEVGCPMGTGVNPEVLHWNIGSRSEVGPLTINSQVTSNWSPKRSNTLNIGVGTRGLTP